MACHMCKVGPVFTSFYFTVFQVFTWLFHFRVLFIHLIYPLNLDKGIDQIHVSALLMCFKQFGCFSTSELPKLTALNLSYCQVSDSGMTLVGKMTSLTTLNADTRSITDAGVAHITCNYLDTIQLVLILKWSNDGQWRNIIWPWFVVQMK